MKFQTLQLCVFMKYCAAYIKALKHTKDTRYVSALYTHVSGGMINVKRGKVI